MAKIYECMTIREMEPGRNVEGFYILLRANVKSSANGSRFLTFRLGDRDGEIEAKMWDYASDIHEHAGSVVKIRGTVSEYNGIRQIIAERIRLAVPGDPYAVSDLVPSAPIDTGATMREVRGMLEQIADSTYRDIALTAWERMKDDLRTLPAAISMHHAFLGGLLMHTCNIMRMCRAAGEVYGTELVDMDLLLAGAFCHDMGKRKEYLRSELGLVTEYSVQGELMGHLTMGSEEIADIARERNIPADCPQVLLLQHLLLSHHGELEYGSPVLPKVIEAEILSRMDMLDARVESYREILDVTPEGSMSEYSKHLGHAVYRHR